MPPEGAPESLAPVRGCDINYQSILEVLNELYYGDGEKSRSGNRMIGMIARGAASDGVDFLHEEVLDDKVLS